MVFCTRCWSFKTLPWTLQETISKMANIRLIIEVGEIWKLSKDAVFSEAYSLKKLEVFIFNVPLA